MSRVTVNHYLHHLIQQQTEGLYINIDLREDGLN